MAIDFAGRKAPYAPLSSLREFFERMREVAVPARVDRRFLQKLNIASNNEWSLLSALKFLGVVDDQGVPTHAYRLLQSTVRFQDTLRHLVESAYKPLIDDGGLSMSVEELRNYFRVTSSPSQAKNAARFFLEVCELAGIQAGPGRRPSPETVEGDAQQRPDDGSGREDHRSSQEPPLPPSQLRREPSSASRVLEAKIALLEKLPAPDPAWPAADYRAICEAFVAMLNCLES